MEILKKRGVEIKKTQKRTKAIYSAFAAEREPATIACASQRPKGKQESDKPLERKGRLQA